MFGLAPRREPDALAPHLAVQLANQECNVSGIEISVVHPGSPDIAICAQWRVAEFAAVLGSSVEAEQATLEAFTAEQAYQIALITRRDGVPAGTCLLVPSEIDPIHTVTPWLAGLYVAPEHRRHGVGQALVRAIEAQARQRGHARLYLYTDDAISYYERLGWRVTDRVAWKGFDTALMLREL
jgi:GNAT superfamily N-acetyltransferase